MAHKVSSVRLIKLHGKAHPREGHRYKNLPWLNVSGVWLEQAGFHIGDQLQVSVAQGELTIKNVSDHGDH